LVYVDCVEQINATWLAGSEEFTYRRFVSEIAQKNLGGVVDL
jgi:hypothetical protein